MRSSPAIAATIAIVASTLSMSGRGRSMYFLKSFWPRTEWRIELKGCLHSGHSALLCDHSWMHMKQKRCIQRSRYARLLKRSRQMGHFESGEVSSAARTVREGAEAEDDGRGEAEEVLALVVDRLVLLVLFFRRLFLDALL